MFRYHMIDIQLELVNINHIVKKYYLKNKLVGKLHKLSSLYKLYSLLCCIAGIIESYQENNLMMNYSKSIECYWVLWNNIDLCCCIGYKLYYHYIEDTLQGSFGMDRKEVKLYLDKSHFDIQSMQLNLCILNNLTKSTTNNSPYCLESN
jgi:hypothetical protein